MRHYFRVKRAMKESLKIQTLRRKRHFSLLLLAFLIGIATSTSQLGTGSRYYYAEAYTKPVDNAKEFKLVMSGSPREVLSSRGEKVSVVQTREKIEKRSEDERLRERLGEIVEESPLKEMIPFIAKRDQRVAAFMVGIAKKESNFGKASPSKEGITCYNYWGYKGSGARGTGMGYACFASAEEAVETVGNRIEVLVKKNRTTPSRMVDTWKCGTSCAGDPNAPGWVSTVALYFDKIVVQES